MRIPFTNIKIPFIVILYALLSFLIVTTWVRKDVFLAHAENGLLLYNNHKTLELSKSFWSENDFGKPSSLNFPGVTVVWFVANLETIGLTETYIQAILFFVLIATAFISMHFLVKDLFPQKTLLLPFAASLFYFGNLYTLTQIWMRFLYTQFFIWSYLPLFLFLWMRWISTKKRNYLILFLATSSLFSYVYVAPTSVFILWIPAAIFSFTQWIRTKKHGNQIILRSLIGITSWFVINIWWIYPIWILRNTAYSGMVDSTANFKSVEAVSQYFPVDQILLLRQTFLLGERSHLYTIFADQSTYTIGYAILFITVYGFFILLKNKNYFIPLLGVISLFIIKGTHPPFGREVYSFLFEHVPSLQMFRNPYEKFGIVFTFAYATVLAVGIVRICEIAKRVKYIVFFVIIYFVIFVLPEPLWSGRVFPENYYVSVPNYYLGINRRISEISDGVILQLPLQQADAGISYKWNYAGEEPSIHLFNNPSSSRSYSQSKGDLLYDSFPLYIQKPTFVNILRNFGISLIVLHEDIILKNGQLPITVSRQYIQNWLNIKFIKKEVDLELYAIEGYRGKIYAVDKPVAYESKTEMLDIMLKENSGTMGRYFYIMSSVYSNLKEYKLSMPSLVYTEESPSSYKIKVTNVDDPFVLFLPQSYNSLWTAKIEDKIIADHFEVNGFANGWLIDKKGDYTIDVVFKVWPWE